MKTGSVELTNKEIRYRVPSILTPNEIKEDLKTVLDFISNNTIELVFIDVSDVKTVISDGLDSIKLMIKAIRLSGSNPIILSVPSQFAPVFSSFLSDTNVNSFKSYRDYQDKDNLSDSQEVIMLKNHFKNRLSKESEKMVQYLEKEDSASKQMMKQLEAIEMKKSSSFEEHVNKKSKTNTIDLFNENR